MIVYTKYVAKKILHKILIDLLKTNEMDLSLYIGKKGLLPGNNYNTAKKELIILTTYFSIEVMSFQIIQQKFTVPNSLYFLYQCVYTHLLL